MNRSLMVRRQIDHPDHGLNFSRTTGERLHSNEVLRPANQQLIAFVWIEINNGVLIQTAATVLPLDVEAISTGPTNQQVTALASGQPIISTLPHQHIITTTAFQSIRTGIAGQQPFNAQFPPFCKHMAYFGLFWCQQFFSIILTIPR